MTDAAVIIPVTSRNSHCHLMAKVAIRTCRASTEADILVIANNTPDEAMRENIRKECDLLGVRYLYQEGPFSISKTFNLGTRETKGKYIAYGTSDVIYYPNWLENIIAHWEANPQYFCLVNYSFDVNNNPCCRQGTVPQDRIVHTHNPSSGVTVLRRSHGYQWDEQFALWEIDADFLYYIEANGLKAGYCLDARCDHLIDGVKPTLDYLECFGLTGEEFYGGSKAKIKAKWGALYKG